jgi:hypothetical protein
MAAKSVSVLLIWLAACGGRTDMMAPPVDGSVPTAVDAKPEQSVPDADLGSADAARGGRWLAMGGSHLHGADAQQLLGVFLDDKIGTLEVLAEGRASDLTWSADGRFLAYATGTEVRVLKSVGKSLVPERTFTSAASYSTPAWSPTQPILAWAGTARGQPAVLFADLRRADEPVVIGGGATAAPLAWSRAGRYIALEVVTTDGSNRVPGFADTWSPSPVAQRLPNGGDSTYGFATSMSFDDSCVVYRGVNLDEHWVAPLANLSAAARVGDLVWQESGGLAEKDPDLGVRLWTWTGASWAIGPWIKAQYVSKAGYLAGICPTGFCVGRIGDQSLAPWYGQGFFVSYYNGFSPDGKQLLAEGTPPGWDPYSDPYSDPRSLYYADLRGEPGNITKIADYQFRTGGFSTNYGWSATSDAFFVTLEGGTHGVLAWPARSQAGIWLAAEDPHRCQDSFGPWAPGGRDLAMVWNDEDCATEETDLHIFRLDESGVTDRAVFTGLARKEDTLRLRWQP